MTSRGSTGRKGRQQGADELEGRVLLGVAGEEKKLVPAAAVAPWDDHMRSRRVAMMHCEAVIVAVVDCVNDDPWLAEARAGHRQVEPRADRAPPAIAPEEELAPDVLATGERGGHAIRVLLERLERGREADLDRREPSGTREERPLELGLLEGILDRVAVPRWPRATRVGEQLATPPVVLRPRPREDGRVDGRPNPGPLQGAKCNVVARGRVALDHQRMEAHASEQDRR